MEFELFSIKLLFFEVPVHKINRVVGFWRVLYLSGDLIPVQNVPYRVGQQEGQQGDNGDGREKLEPR